MVNSPPWPQWLRSEFDGMTSAGVALFVGAPLLVGVLLGWNRMVVGSHMSRPGATLYWIGLIGIVWVAAIVGTRLPALRAHVAAGGVHCACAAAAVANP